MKTIFRSILAILTAAAVLASCNKEVEVVKTLTTDVNAVTDVAASNPAEISVALTNNVKWIVQTPEWITPSAVFGSGDAILTFKVGENYVNETTTVAPRTGEIKISGGGSIDGVGVSASVTVSQLGYTYVDPNAPIEQIPDAAEFIDFIKAINGGNKPTRWMNDNGEVTLSNDIDLSEFTDWQQFVTAANNGNNSSKVEGKAFSGVFNGNGYKITGFNPTVHLAANQTFGLFSLLNEGVVKNVVLEGNMNVTAEGQADAGMLVGTAFNSTVQNVTVNGKITSAGTTVANRFSIGGVCGYAYAGVIGETDFGNTLFEDCVVNAEVDFVGGSNTANGATCAMYGGICGFATTPNAANPHKVTIRNCVNNGDLDATAEGYKGTAGGIFALAGSATITVIEGVENYGISVREHGEDVIFLRKIIRGGADKSFGIHVARLAGVPRPVLVRAHEIQARLEVSNINQKGIGQNILEEGEKRPDEQVNLFDFAKTEIINELQSIDVMALTPMDAINKLFLLREKARKL